MSLLGTSLNAKVSTNIHLNANQQYALKILHSPTLDLEAFLAQKLEENPFLLNTDDEFEEESGGASEL